MAKEASVAPKERVNITYRPATGDAREEVELPLKVLVLGDFTLAPDDRGLENREPINVNKDNINEVLKAQNISLELKVPNRLSEKPEDEMKFKLQFSSLKDFQPEALVDQIPELQKLVGLRDALMSLGGPLSNIPEFRKKITELIKDEAARKQLLKELGIEG